MQPCNFAEPAGSHTTALEDAALAARSRDGDLEAFDELVRRHQRMVYSVAYRMVGDPHEAADLAKEAFVRAYRALRGFRGQSSFSTWLYRITVNVAKNQLRSWGRRHRSSTVSLDAAAGDDPDEGTAGIQVADAASSPRDEAVSRERSAQVQAAIGELPVGYRTVIVLRDLQGLAYGEVAQAVGIPVGTVKAQIHRGRLLLREILRTKGWAP